MNQKGAKKAKGVEKKDDDGVDIFNADDNALSKE